MPPKTMTSPVLPGQSPSKPDLKSIDTASPPDTTWLLLFRLALAACLAFITWMALTSSPPTAGGLFALDKVNHLVAFVTLAFLAHNAFPAGSR